MKKLLIALFPLFALVAAILLGWRSFSGLNTGMEYPRSEIHAAVLDKKIYVAGGIGLFRVLDSCEVYDVADQTWSRCPDLPRPLHHVAMTADDQRIYASGGYVALPFQQDQDPALFAYEPGTDAWLEIAKLPHPIGQHAMFHHARKIYLIGGQNGSADLDSFWAYDLDSGNWSKMPPMPTKRHSHAIAVDGNRLYVTGGRNADLGPEIAVNEMFDFSDGTWTTLPEMPTGRGGHGAVVSQNSLHIFGGESISDSAVISQHDVLDLQTQKWTRGQPLIEPRHGFAIASGETLDDIYVVGGGALPALHTVYSVSSTIQKLKR